MTNKSKKTKFLVNDIVTIVADYKNANLNFAQPLISVYKVKAINKDGTITLSDIWQDIPVGYIEGIPIESELAKQIYYDTNHARFYEPSKMYQLEDIYSRPPFMVTMAEKYRNTSVWEDMQKEEFRFVHELQHWLVEHYGISRICVNQFWGMRKPLKL